MRTAALLLLGCSFEAGSPGDVGPNVGETTTGTGDPTSAAVTTSPSSTVAPSTSGSTAADSSGAATTSGSDESTGGTTTGAECTDADAVIVSNFLQDNVTMPMVVDSAAPPILTYAYSTEENEGTVVFEFDVLCGGNYALWGLVYDEITEPFDDGGNADSFAVRVDAGTEVEWSYGCSTLFQLDAWSYERVGVAAILDCAAPEELLFPLAPGPHSVTFRALEVGDPERDGPGAVAAVARIALTMDESYLPDPDLD